MDTVYHIPVMPEKSMEALSVDPDGTYADLTFGGGGHSRLILERLQAGGGHLYAFDQDADAEANAPSDAHFTFVRSNFRYLKNFMRYYGVESLDGIFADLGVSSHHFDQGERGFSFRYDAPLDMRMNQREGMTAADLIGKIEESSLADIMFRYGELRNAKRIARALVEARSKGAILTTGQLASIVQPILGPDREKKDLAKVFQALRIEVNHEMEALEEMLISATGMLKSGGKLVVLTYHSLEDRLVKNVMRSGNVEGKIEKDFFGNVNTPYIISKVLTADAEEVERNPRSRSAKLRAAEKR